MMRDLVSENKHLTKWYVIGAITWTCLLAVSLYWNYSNEQQKTTTSALIEASSHFNKDKAFRFWGASHGGIYVPADERTPPNPRLSHIPERDVITPSGKKLTLMNPAYMIRMMMHEYEELYGVKGKITTFPDKLFYEGNMPDDWELAALRSFQQGEKEAKEIADIKGVPHMRLMRPLYIKQDCLKCHGDQGYKVGDLRGAVGVSVSMQPYIEAEQEVMKAQFFTYFLIWMSGLLAMGYFFTRAKAQAQELFNLEQQFNQAQKMEAIGTLVGGIAHDFNNMLAGMTGNLYLAKKNVQDRPNVVHKLTKVEQLSFRAAEMIQQLLTFARKGQISIKTFPLTPFINEALKLCSSTLPENIEFHQSICRDPLSIDGDGTQIHQALMNLINNARDAVDSVDNPRITIRLEAFYPDDAFVNHHTYFTTGAYAHLSVEDNGCGIPEDKIEHLFEPFFTTKEVGKGTGLGLAMVFGATKSHGGFVEVDSIEGEGSTFHVYLPLVEAEDIASESPSEKEVIQGYGELILLVDDEKNILETGKEVLEAMGYQVLSAPDGMKAIEIFTANQDRISLIIMDLVMPRLGGAEAIERIREICPDIKVIFSSGYDKEATLPDKIYSSETVTLSKPYKIEELSKAIRNQLDS